MLALAAGHAASKSSLEKVLAGSAHTATSSVWAISAVSVLGVLALMILFSTVVQALRNPLFLVIGGLIGLVLPRLRG
jgi:hypothetical protein